ncbi:hypothetical protein ACP6PL_15840 [Dapis sp. BLCC M126]|uniref:hypothetical protein n=1 Tax=Dapis sp. BLCC M126 TaxID=3400189 RepID=UPI003CE9EE76
MSTVLGFSATSIVFSINLPNQPFLSTTTDSNLCYSCLILKIFVCIFLAITILICVQGFLPKASGGMTPPQILMDEYYGDSDERCRLVITKTWIEALQELENSRYEKAEFTKKAIIMLSIAALLAAIDIILATFIPLL